jgi:hypothetical protein
MDELDHDVLGVGAGCPGAEDDQGAAAVEPNGHGMACSGDRRGIVSQLI